MTRRGLLLGGSALVLAAAGGAAWQWNLFGKHYPPTPYDDVLGRLRDRDWAQKFGAQALTPNFRADAAAARLRQLLGNGDLESAALRDTQEGRVVEAAKWLVPESVAQMAMLAASTK